MSQSSITFSLDGKKETSDIVQAISDRISKAASRASTEAAEFHAEMARQNVHNGYATRDFPKISFTYAKWLIQTFEVEAMGKSMTDAEIDKAAKDLVENKRSLILTGELLDGIWSSESIQIGNSIYAEVHSDAPYSKNLEEGILFNRNTDKRRPFFTIHLSETKDFMLSRFSEHLGRT